MSSPGTASEKRIPTAAGVAKFGVGQLVRHKLFDYRGVVYDVDPVFQGTDPWYRKMAKTRPPRDRPWYHVLVDGGEHTTYVAERNLEGDDTFEAIDHPLVAELFVAFSEGSYQSTQEVH